MLGPELGGHGLGSAPGRSLRCGSRSVAGRFSEMCSKLPGGETVEPLTLDEFAEVIRHTKASSPEPDGSLYDGGPVGDRISYGLYLHVINSAPTGVQRLLLGFHPEPLARRAPGHRGCRRRYRRVRANFDKQRVAQHGGEGGERYIGKARHASRPSMREVLWQGAIRRTLWATPVCPTRARGVRLPMCGQRRERRVLRDLARARAQ